jgi:hypothetical protein
LLPFSFVLATFFGIILPSAKVLDFIVKSTAAPAAPAKLSANDTVAAAVTHLLIMAFL